MESAMTTIGHKDRDRYPTSVDRKKNLTPHTLSVPGGVGASRAEAQMILPKPRQNVEEAQLAADDSGLLKQLKGTGKAPSPRHQARSQRPSATTERQPCELRPTPSTGLQDGATDVRRLESEPMSQEDNTLADINSH